MTHIDKYLFYDEKVLREKPSIVIVGDYSGITPNKLAEQFNIVPIVYEADRQNYLTLISNINKDGIDVIPINKALSGSDGIITMYRYETPSSNSRFMRSDKKLIDKGKVQAVSVESHIKLFGEIDLLLMNIEGGEFDILEEILNKDLPVGQICVSYHFFAAKEKADIIMQDMFSNYRTVRGNTKYNYFLYIKE